MYYTVNDKSFEGEKFRGLLGSSGMQGKVSRFFPPPPSYMPELSEEQKFSSENFRGLIKIRENCESFLTVKLLLFTVSDQIGQKNDAGPKTHANVTRPMGGVWAQDYYISVEAIKAHQNVLSLQYMIFMALYSLYSQYSLLEYIMSHKRWKIISTSRLVRVEMMMMMMMI